MRRRLSLGLVCFLFLGGCSSDDSNVENEGVGAGGSNDIGGSGGSVATTGGHAGSNAGAAGAKGGASGSSGQGGSKGGTSGTSGQGGSVGGNAQGGAGAAGTGNAGSGGSAGGTSGSSGQSGQAGSSGNAGGGQGGASGMGGAMTGGSAGAAGNAGGAGASGEAGAAGDAGAGGASGAGNGGTDVGGSSGEGGAAGSAGEAGAGGMSGAGGTGGSSLGDATIVPGAPNRILLLGTVVTPDQVFDGAVLVKDTTIECAAAGDTCTTMTDAMGATVITTNGVIAPGMIDMHNHILFDIFDDDDWYPTKLYTNHNQWTNEAGYHAMLTAKHCLANETGAPTWCPPAWNSTLGSLKCEMNKYGEIKGLIAGATSIVGLPGTTAACFASLARSIDTPENDLGSDTIQTSSLFPPSAASADGVCSNYTSGKTKAYLIHCGEGLPSDTSAANEFGTLGTVTTTDDCLYAPETVITHGMAFGMPEFATMGMDQVKLTWSPQSNVSLYGATADIPTALAQNVLISLGPDWSMGGSLNMLDEMRFANSWDDAHFGDVLTTKDLFLMATVNAAKSLQMDDRLGSLDVGKLADIMVVGGDPSTPYDAILGSSPKDVRLVMVGGTVLYGDSQLVAAGPASPGCETLSVCGASKFGCFAESSTANKLNQSYGDITTALEAALTQIDGITDPSKPANTFSPLAPLVKCP